MANQRVADPREMVNMGENRYALAGWLSIVQAILYPMAVGIGIIQGVIGVRAFRYAGPTLGPSDLMMLLFTLILIYTLMQFRNLLNERYSFREINTLILLAIGWSVAFHVIGLLLKISIIALWPVDRVVLAIVYFGFIVLALIGGGIINILIGVKLLKEKDTFSGMITAYGYLCLIAGILQVSIFLGPLALLGVPVGCIILAMIFLRDPDEVDFV